MQWMKVLLGWTLATAVWAAEPPLPGDDYFQLAQQALLDNQRDYAQVMKFSSSGDPANPADKAKLLAMINTMDGHLQQFTADLQLATEAGHPIAPWQWANLVIEGAATPIKDVRAYRKEACRLYGLAAERGLLAGAVALVTCPASARVFDMDEPEDVHKMALLKAALEGPDKYADYYPLPTQRSFCFPVDLTARTTNGTTSILSLAQYRTEGYYLLAFIHPDPDKSPDSVQAGYLRKAFHQGCKQDDDFGLRRAYKLVSP